MTVLATHVVLSMYGFWLPNDPRGSWTNYVGSRDLFLAGGKATKIETRRSVATKPHDRKKREATKQALKFPPVMLNGLQARAVARGFAATEQIVYACAIMPEHTHLVLARSKIPAKDMAKILKQKARRRKMKKRVIMVTMALLLSILGMASFSEHACRCSSHDPLRQR